MEILVHVEVPYSSRVKYEIENNRVIVDRVIPSTMHYPGNYGYIPNTLADDGDPIDVLVMNDEFFCPNSYVKCKVLGMLITEDEKGLDQKVIAVPCNNIDRTYEHINNINDLGTVKLNIIKDFFTNYKNNEPNKWVKCGEFKNFKETITFINQKTLIKNQNTK